MSILDRISEPADVRRLAPCELDDVAGELRAAIIESVAENGGHLGSNLGTVELTLALHRAFDSPHDAVVWDTGHQTYAHKLVTGRQDAFARLRRADGASGYPARDESEHDLVENSHASTSLSYAYGLAVARDLAHERRHVVAVIGDGALTGGMAYEGLNNLGHSGRRVIVVLNDNGRSYAPTVSRLTAGGGGDTCAFFAALGLHYLGPVDGHDVAALERALVDARGYEDPVVVHVITRKGCGYQPAEDDEEKCLHDVTPFDPATGCARTPRAPSYTDAFAAALTELGACHPELVALTAAMPTSTGVAPFAAQFPDRCFDVGIAEQHAMTAAAGMAMRGLRPVFAVYATFLNRAWDQLLYDVALHALPVVLCIDRAGITGDDGPSHHGVYDLALLTRVPGMTTFMPSSCDEVGVMLADALEITSGPVALRWPKTPPPRSIAGGVGTGRHGRALLAGTEVCILAVGNMVQAAEEAAVLLEAHDVRPTVWDVRTVPLDAHLLADARRHSLVVTVEDGIAEGGVGSLVAGTLAQEPERPRVVVLGTPPGYLPHAKPAELLARLGLDGAGIAAAVVKALDGD
jgi:1-deoxy-D-xylulose-5-phosphate synthase